MARRTPSQLNMLLAVDKPVGCTSHDVVSQCRRALHERRVGHAGTLDPMASGVMVVGVGQATRLLGMLTLDTKSYVADISFGAETNTDDAEGEALRTVPVASELRDPAYARERLAAALANAEIRPPRIPVVSNVDARPHDNPEEIRGLLEAQLVNPVLWADSMQWLLEDFGVEQCYEIGPGRVLRGLLKRINRKFPCESVPA